MLSLLGLSMIGGSIIGISYPAFESVFLKHRYNRKKLIENLYKAFENAAFNNKFEVFPSLLKLQINPTKITFVFSVPKGMNPEDINKKSYVFKQHFGEHISLDVNESRVVLEVYKKGLPPKHKYNWNDDQRKQSKFNYNWRTRGGEINTNKTDTNYMGKVS